MQTRQEVLAGVGLGFAVGILVGMSTSPVVAIVVSSLAAVLATFFGLSAPSNDATRVLRIASFGFACPVAVILGLGVRSHNWLGPSVEQQIKDWTNAGYTVQQARAFVAFRQLGLVPEGQKTAAVPKSSVDSGLFSAPDSTNDPVVAECGRLVSSRFPTANERLDAMKRAGGVWKTLGDSIVNPNSAQSAAVIEAAYRLACH
jgi:hypothetical protein